MKRKSPLLPLIGATPSEIADSIRTLEERPRMPAKTPASSSAPGFKGEYCFDASYIYICVSEDTWKRAALSAF